MKLEPRCLQEQTICWKECLPNKISYYNLPCNTTFYL